MMNLLTVIGVGFLLGIRHATDPDHVIAVTTIVSRQRSIRHAGLIGILWGVGHTITILLVGAAIILFNLAIPPRIGLAMELAVGLMLILLGVLNLTGVTQWVTQRFTPGHKHEEVIHSHAHTHGGEVHAHIHGHNPEVHMHRIGTGTLRVRSRRRWREWGCISYFGH
jgi:ABC-type nickel/cobalt efflux system permease component RcnA